MKDFLFTTGRTAGLAATLMLAAAPVWAASSAQVPAIEIARWYGDKAAAISYTFDDGYIEQYTLAVPQLEARGWRGSFTVNGSRLGDDAQHRIDSTRLSWPEIEDMARRGHEISNHGWAHKNFARTEFETLKRDILMNDSAIEAHTGQRPLTFCYPNNNKSQPGRSFAVQGRVGTRTFQRSIGSKSQPDELCRWTDRLVDNRDWGVGMTHGITYGYDNFGRNQQVLWDHFDYVKSREDSIWVGTLAAVSAYLRERDECSLNISELKSSGRKQVLSVSCSSPLDAGLFRQPLTLVVRQAGITKAEAVQDGRRIAVDVRPDKALLDIDPNGGEIRLDIRLGKTAAAQAVAEKPHKAHVILVAGQSNTDGRVPVRDLPPYIKALTHDTTFHHGAYPHCLIAQNDTLARFVPFWPHQRLGTGRWAYDAVTFYLLDSLLQEPFYVIKWAVGGTAIAYDTTNLSRKSRYWSADPDWLAGTTAYEKGGHSLLLDFIEEIDLAIDSTLSKLPQGYQIDAFIWHQGESDSKHGEAYYNNLKGVVTYVRRHLTKKTGQNCNRLPFIFGTVARSNKQYSREVENAMHQWAQDDDNSWLIDLQDASLQGDHLHFDAPSAEEFGRLVFERLEKLPSIRY